MQKIYSAAAIFILTLVFAVFLPTRDGAADQPMHILVPSHDLEIAVVSNFISINQLFLPSNGVALITPAPAQQDQGYIFYGYNWQTASAKLARVRIGEEITLNFPSAQPKTFVVSNLFAVSPKSDNQASLANNPDTLLIYSSQGMTDREQLVILAKAKPSTAVSSL